MAENIKVICRVRPLNESELSSQSKFVLGFPGDGKTTVSIQGRNYNFDGVIQPKATQVEVYDIVAKPIVADVLNGYNGTIFAYGQTASGKTFTMEGVLGDAVFQGVIPRIIHDIFNHIYQMDENLEFHIKVSYFEIYMDKIRDLLDDKDRVPYVKGATERFVSSPEDVFEVIDEGKANRHVAVTNMNEHSSRSHSVFMINVRQENLETKKKLHGKLYLVDLAGSEKVAKTGAEGQVLDEAKNINKSLSALGIVINALVESSPHVPYRDSKLTRILQESLGGNARTTMVICCSPAAYNDSETKSTLMFGMRAKTIKNMVTINEELTADEWRRRYERLYSAYQRLWAEYKAAKEELARWRGGETISVDDQVELSANMPTLDDTKDRLPAPAAPGGPTIPTPTPTASPAAAAALPQQRPATSPGLGVAAAAVANVNTTLIDEDQIQALYNQMDDKDDEINKRDQKIARLQANIEEQDELIRSLRADRDAQTNDLKMYQTDCQASKDEVKEVLQALEELAMNYDQKTQELEAKMKELDSANENNLQMTRLMTTKDSELTRAKDSQFSQKKKYSEIMTNLLKDLADVGESMNDQLTKPSFAGGERLDEEFTVTRLYISKLKTEAKSLQSRVRQLEEDRVQHTHLLQKSEDEGKELQVRIHSLECKVTSLSDKNDESESRKRHLQETVDQLNAELAKLQAKQELLGSGQQNSELLAGQSSIKTQLDEGFKRQSEVYALQVKQLRDEIDEKAKQLETLKDEANNAKFQYETASDELVKVRQELEVKTNRLENLEKAVEKREQAKQDLRGLEETVAKELQTLHHLRRLFVADLKQRIKQSTNRMNAAAAATATNNSPAVAAADSTTPASGTPAGAVDEIGAGLVDDDEDEASATANMGPLAQREKIAFLENNLDKLTRVHKQLVQDNAELRNELPKLEKRLRCTVERVRALEVALREAKEGAMRDRKRYQVEVERIKDVVRQRNVTARRGQSQIAKPIRAGHFPTTTKVE